MKEKGVHETARAAAARLSSPVQSPGCAARDIRRRMRRAMDIPLIASLICVILVMPCVSSARAGTLEEACALVFKRLGSGPYEELTRSNDGFANEGKRLEGCVIRFSGIADAMTGPQHPDGLFGAPLPYCPDGTLPADLPPQLLNRDGWCNDRITAGQNSSSYRALGPDIFCLVESRWDGGDPGGAQAPRRKIVVKCSGR